MTSLAFTCSLVLPVLAMAVPKSCSPEARGGASGGKEASVDVDVYKVDHGRADPVKPGKTCRTVLIDAGLALLAESTERYKRVVSQDLVDTLLREGVALRLVFHEPRRVRSSALGRELDVSEIVIPLSGPMAKGKTTVFFGDPDFQEGNVAVRPGVSPDRKTIERCLGIRR